MKKAILLAVGLFVIISANAQTGKVGVNTTKPTETHDVNGTGRVRILPLSGTANAIHTKPDGTMSETKNQTFTATKTVVADNNGVLGVVNGINNNNSVSDYKNVTSVLDNNFSDAIELQAGCLKLVLDPYNSGAEVYMTLKAQVLPSCTDLSEIWSIAIETGGADVGGAQQAHARKNLNTTNPVDLSGFYHRIRYSPLFMGRIALEGLKQKQVYEFTYTGNKRSDSSYDISLQMRQLY